MNVLVTGASGFVGGAVVARLMRDERHNVRVAVRGHASGVGPAVERTRVGDLDANTDWRVALRDMEAVVHCAARVHVMRDVAANPLTEFRRVNVEGTLALARAAVAAGVRRFVFISSIKVNGECTLSGRSYTAADEPRPRDPYGVSKLEAELGLRALAGETGLQLAIIRPVLVYGPGVGGNFLSLMQWLRRGVPLPLGAAHNRRSLVSVENLADLIVCCMQHPSVSNDVFLVSDGEDLSVTELLRRMGDVLGAPARLVPVPAAMLRAAAALAGKSAVARRLVDPLQVDITSTRRRLAWTPPQTVDDALRATARHFLQMNAA